MVNIEAEKEHLDLENGKVGDDERVENGEEVGDDEELGEEVNFFCFEFVLHYQQLFEVFHKWCHRNDHN